MTEFVLSDSFSVTAGPNTTGRLRNGDTDNLYWVRGVINTGLYWRGPFPDVATADAEARRMITDFYSSALLLNALCYVEYGKRYYLKDAKRWRLLPILAYNTPPPEPMEADPVPTVYDNISWLYGSHCLLNGHDDGEIHGEVHTDLYGPLGGRNTIIKSIETLPPDDAGKSYYPSDNEENILIFISVNEVSTDDTLTLVGASMEYVTCQRQGRLVYRADDSDGVGFIEADDAQIIMSASYIETNCTVHGDAPTTDPTVFRDGGEPTQYCLCNNSTRASKTAIIPVGEWTPIVVPNYLVPDTTLIPDGKYALDDTFSYISVTFRARSVYADPDGNLVYGDWVNQSNPLNLCRSVKGPYGIYPGVQRTSPLSNIREEYPPKLKYAQADLTGLVEIMVTGVQTGSVYSNQAYDTCTITFPSYDFIESWLFVRVYPFDKATVPHVSAGVRWDIQEVTNGFIYPLDPLEATHQNTFYPVYSKTLNNGYVNGATWLTDAQVCARGDLYYDSSGYFPGGMTPNPSFVFVDGELLEHYLGWPYHITDVSSGVNDLKTYTIKPDTQEDGTLVPEPPSKPEGCYAVNTSEFPAPTYSTATLKLWQTAPNETLAKADNVYSAAYDGSLKYANKLADGSSGFTGVGFQIPTEAFDYEIDSLDFTIPAGLTLVGIDEVITGHEQRGGKLYTANVYKGPHFATYRSVCIIGKEPPVYLNDEFGGVHISRDWDGKPGTSSQPKGLLGYVQINGKQWPIYDRPQSS